MKLLVLLIGGNNIANYALIDYFKKNDEFHFDKVVLIYTSQTINGAKNIIDLQKDVEFIEINLENNGRNLLKINEILFAKLNSLNPTFIHLNYTGGTKPMSVGSYLAVKDLDCHKRFSDISPDSSKLTFANGDIYPKNDSIADGVNLDIKSLYKLHGIELVSLKRQVSKYFDNKIINKLYEMSINHTEYNEFWEIWDKNMSKKAEKEFFMNNWKKTLPILKELSFENIDFEKIGKKSLEKLKKFISGGWLEEYVFSVLADENFNDIAFNVFGSKKGRNFELDLVITKGYKSYVLSCTTATNLGVIKQKAFEASMRAEQIGGIRAQPISISLLDNNSLEELEKDVESYVGKSKFSFVLQEDLKNRDNLKQKFRQIF